MKQIFNPFLKSTALVFTTIIHQDNLQSLNNLQPIW